jgi:hypothetical protein
MVGSYDVANWEGDMIGLLLLVAIGAGKPTDLVTGMTDGERLYSACRADPSGLCLGYVAGAYDQMQIDEKLGLKDMYCVPPSATLKQMRDVVTRYLAAHSDKRAYSAAQEVGNAFNDAWPCPPGPKLP